MLIVLVPDEVEKTGLKQVTLRLAFQLFMAVARDAAGTFVLLMRTVELGAQL
jgi:hypothetical protein